MSKWTVETNKAAAHVDTFTQAMDWALTWKKLGHTCVKFYKDGRFWASVED